MENKGYPIPPFQKTQVCNESSDFYNWLSRESLEKAEENLSRGHVEGGPEACRALTALKLQRILNRYEAEDKESTMTQILYSQATKEKLMRLLKESPEVNPKPYFLKLADDDIRKTNDRREVIAQVGLDDSIRNLKEREGLTFNTIMQIIEVYLSLQESAKDMVDVGQRIMDALEGKPDEVKYFAADLVAGMAWAKLATEQEDLTFDKKYKGKFEFMSSLSENSLIREHLLNHLKGYPYKILISDYIEYKPIDPKSEENTFKRCIEYLKRYVLPKIKTISKGKSNERNAVLSNTQEKTLSFFLGEWFDILKEGKSPAEQLQLLDKIEEALHSTLGSQWKESIKSTTVDYREALKAKVEAISKVLEDKLEW
jgi:hypothetical protein